MPREEPSALHAWAQLGIQNAIGRITMSRCRVSQPAVASLKHRPDLQIEITPRSMGPVRFPETACFRMGPPAVAIRKVQIPGPPAYPRPSRNPPISDIAGGPKSPTEFNPVRAPDPQHTACRSPDQICIERPILYKTRCAICKKWAANKQKAAPYARPGNQKKPPGRAQRSID